MGFNNSRIKGLLPEEIIHTESVGGGCIGSSMRVHCEKHDYFVKQYGRKGVSEKEAHGLSELDKSGTIRIPKLIAFDEQVIILEYIESGSKSRDFQKKLGSRLAQMHRQTADQFGFYENNYIGSTDQINDYKGDWKTFYLENRLRYQVELAGNSQISSVFKKFEKILPELLKGSEEVPALIHGDLWGGNVMCDSQGDPVIFDPAVCYAHRELELGMTMLFGGFTGDFYDAYDKEYSLKEGWRQRMNLYILYHVLNHYNLFGGSYAQQAISLMKGYF